MRVKATARQQNVYAVCQYPKWTAIEQDLKAALEFEFNLPYPDGSTMDLVKEAIAAFKTRLKGKENQNEEDTAKLDIQA